MTVLSIDFNHDPRTWWDNGGTDLWDAITGGFEENSIVIDDDVATSWLATASGIEGWDAGPDYAPHPITSRPADEDEG